MSKTSTPRMNKVLTSLIWDSFLHNSKFRWQSSTLYIFFLYFFSSFYVRNYLYTPLMWTYNYLNIYFFEKSITNYYYRLNYPDILLNYRILQKFILNTKRLSGKLYRPGSIYIYYYAANYHLISTYIQGSLRTYSMLSQPVTESRSTGQLASINARTTNSLFFKTCLY